MYIMKVYNENQVYLLLMLIKHLQLGSL